MLSTLVYLLILFVLNLPAIAEEKAIDLAWIKNLNRQAEHLTHTHQNEAKAIVDQALNSSTQQKQCKVAEIFAHQAQQITRKNLDIPSYEENTRYPDLLVFVSFSLPLETLKTLATQVNQVGGKVVLRGLVNNSFKETAEKVKELEQDVMIDPPLFEDYHVKVVPTFILRKKNLKDEPYDQLSGNVSFEYALEQFAAHGITKTEAHEFLKALRTKP